MENVKKKTRLISKFLAGLIFTALNFVEKKLNDLLNNELVNTGVLSLLTPIRQTVQAVSDENPQNKEQVEAIWKRYVNKDVTELADQSVSLAIQEIENDNYRTTVAHFAPVLTDVIRKATDENPNNQEQINDCFKAFLKEPKTDHVTFVLLLPELLNNRVENAIARELIIEILRSAFNGQIDKWDTDTIHYIGKMVKENNSYIEAQISEAA